MGIANKNVLLTGASGLVGFELLTLLSRQHNVKIYAVSRSDIIKPQENVTVLPYDFSEPYDLSLFPKRADVIIHLAMSPNYKAFPDKSIDVFNVNTVSTAYLLDYAYRSNTTQFIFASSGVYNSPVNPHYEDEDISLSSFNDYYLSTKICSEMLVKNYAHLFNTSIMRLFYVYGIRQRKSMLVPRLIENVRNNREISIDKNGGIEINPIYVSDAATALCKCIGIDGCQTFNISGDEVISMRSLANMIGEILGIEPVFRIDRVQQSMVADNTKMKSALTTPSVSLKEGLKIMISNLS